MLEITMHGYFGFDNIGDEAILYSIIQGLKSINQNVRITVLSSSPAKTSRRYNVDSISRVNFLKIIGNLRDSHLFISGGGSLLQDITSFYSPLYYLFVMQLAATFAENAVFAFQGFGPLKRSILRKLTVKTLARMDEISVRDENSRKRLAQMGLPADKIRQVVDPVFLLTPKAECFDWQKSGPNSQSNNTGGRYNLGVALRPWKNNKYLPEVVKALNRFSRENPLFKITLIPLHYESDIKPAKSVKGKLENNDVSLLSPIDHPQEITEIFSDLDLLLGVRLHSLIFATMLGIPCVGIEYDPKIPAFLSQMELEPVGKTDKISAREIYHDLKYYWHNRSEISSMQRKYALDCRKEIKEYLELLVNYAG